MLPRAIQQFKRQLSTKIYIQGLSWKTNENNLENALKRFGTIEKVILGDILVKGKPAKNSLVTFKTFDGARKAITEINCHELDGRILKIDFTDKTDEIFIQEHKNLHY